MRQTVRNLVLALIVSLATVASASATEWWEQPTSSAPATEGGREARSDGKAREAWQVDWPDATIRAMAGATADMKGAVNAGHARSMALKTARHLAYERLAETVKGIRIDAESTYDRELMLDSNLKTHVSALVRGARVVEERVTKAEDGSIWAEVSVELPLFGSDQALAGPTSHWVMEKGQIVRRSFEGGARAPSRPLPARHAGTGAERPSASAEIAASTTANAAGAPTGVVIDAVGLAGVAAMLPRVLDPDGKVVYGAGDVPSHYLVRHGLVGYAATVESARTSKRSGENPLVIRPLRMRGPDVVVSKKDAAKLIAANRLGQVLDKCRVTIVLGEQGGK